MVINLYKTAADFPMDTGALSIMKSVVSAVDIFFPLFLFLFFLLGTAASYFAAIKLSGRRRFWQSLTGMSFASFIVSLLIASMNSTDVTFLSGYWVGFYIVMTLFSWYGLTQYK